MGQNGLDFLDELFGDSSRFEGRTGRRINSKASSAIKGFPKYDMYKENDEYFIELAVAGYSPQDIGISIEDGNLIIESDKVEHEGREYLERTSTSKEFKRIFSLNEKVDDENISARFVNGMLQISLPLKEEQKPKSRVVSIDT